MLELNKWELIEALKKGLSEDFNLVQTLNGAYGEYQSRKRYRINDVGEGELDWKYIPNLTTEDCEWDAYALLKFQYGMSRKEVDEWKRPQPEHLSRPKAEAEQWAEYLCFTDWG
jgi:phosphoribosyl-AMP cyclohydrolase